MSSYGLDSARLEREVEEQRRRIEHRISEIRERLSPGELVDQVLGYGRDGGKQFATNLGNTLSNNPLPAALLGISLLWLIAGQGPRLSMSHRELEPLGDYGPDYPYAIASGGRMRRIGHAADEAGMWHSEFEDLGGKRYRAESNEMGHRLGAFIDDTGRKFGGFIDEAGNRVRDFQDEAGNRMDVATGWASDRWRDVQEGVGTAMDQATQQAQQLGGTAQQQMDRMSRAVASGFYNQPLVAGALAFAAGAALGGFLPNTAQEDRMLGPAADRARRQATGAASDLYEAGKQKAAELYEKGKQGAGQVYDDLRDKTPGTHEIH